MAEDTQLILQAIKTQGEKIGQLADSVDKLVEKLSNNPPQALAVAPKSGNNWQLLSLMIALLMIPTTSMWIVISGISTNLKSHDTQENHPGYAAQAAVNAFHIELEEVETQFKGVREKIGITHDFQDKLIEEGRVWRANHDHDYVSYLRQKLFEHGLPGRDQIDLEK